MIGASPTLVWSIEILLFFIQEMKHQHDMYDIYIYTLHCNKHTKELNVSGIVAGGQSGCLSMRVALLAYKQPANRQTNNFNFSIILYILRVETSADL